MLKKLMTFFLLVFISLTLAGQKNYWQQVVNVTINVALNDVEHTLDAYESLEYINHSPDTLRFIWFHLWPNAYKNDKTAFSEDLLRARRTDFYFSKASDKGYINQLDFKADGKSVITIFDSTHTDMVKLLLPQPLAPGGNTIITTPFRVKLPFNFSRGGHVGRTYQVTQWFPKPALYDGQGWHPMPYVDQGEYYAEFGKYDVQITTPSAYLVAATGLLQDAETMQQIKKKGKHIVEGKTKTWHFVQHNIHDFAWFASKEFVAKFDTVVLPSKKVVDVFSYYKPKSKGWDVSIGYMKDAIRKYSKWLGDYPYTTATIVKGSKTENSGGMEYPTITLITMQTIGKDLDATIAHELGHNWFEAAIATNERDHPWMDEGMNSYYTKRYEAEKYKSAALLKKTAFDRKLPEDEEEILLPAFIKLHKDQPIATTSQAFSPANYLLVAYYKTTQWMKKLEADMGRENFDKAMHQYYSQWQFKHPMPQDFKAIIESSTKTNVAANFAQLNTTGSLYPAQKKTIKPTFLFNLRNTDKYNYIGIAPAIGYNGYDQAMIGGLIHKYQLPLNKFQFVGGALYGIGSHKLNGFGSASYNIYQRRQHISFGVGYMNYSMNNFLLGDNTKLYQRMQRFTPSVSVVLFDKDPLSTRRFEIGWKTFLLKEDALDFETVATSTDTFDVVKNVPVHSYINRLSIGVSDNRKLFPYSIVLSTDQGREFVRTGITAKGFFNYADGKTGMSVRLFAGKFFYLKSKTQLTRYNNDRYALNLSAPKGYDDYTYSDYFSGRNQFEGWKSQQVMERDGFFKVNTELLSDKVGKTDDWLMALNLSTGLPDKVNPLSVLPFKLPIKLFADIGTYAEAWKGNAPSGRFVYDGGVQLTLFGGLVDVYVPIVYSSVYSNYYKSTITEKRFLKSISFTINIQELQLRKMFKDLPL